MWAPATDFHTLVTEALERGDIIKTQAKVPKNSKEGYAHFVFKGGTYNGVTLRLYPPFDPFTYQGETWELTKTFTKNGRQTRSIYLLKETS